MNKRISKRYIIIGIIVLSLLVTRLFFVCLFKVPTGSMEGTIHENDVILGIRLLSEADRGDIVVFKIEEEKGIFLVKRVIGIPGDHIELTENEIYINGEKMKESYLKEEMDNNLLLKENESITYDVPENCYFLMGDNRNQSKDSRYFKQTYVPRENIKYRVVYNLRQGCGYWKGVE